MLVFSVAVLLIEKVRGVLIQKYPVFDYSFNQ